MVPHCMFMTFCGMSLLMMAAIALDRYLTISRTVPYETKPQKLALISAVCFIYSAVISFIPMYNDKMHGEILPGQSCRFDLIYDGNLLIEFLLLFLPPFFVILFCHGAIFRIAHKQSNQIHAQDNIDRQRVKNIKHHRKVPEA